jgi:hypothetical protein
MCFLAGYYVACLHSPNDLLRTAAMPKNGADHRFKALLHRRCNDFTREKAVVGASSLPQAISNFGFIL